jgi:hypothetical protein
MKKHKCIAIIAQVICKREAGVQRAQPFAGERDFLSERTRKTASKRFVRSERGLVPTFSFFFTAAGGKKEGKPL